VLPAKFVQNFERVGDDNVVMFTSRLHIEHVEDEDSGDYQCVISNTLGASYSQHAHISVHGTFLPLPRLWHHLLPIFVQSSSVVPSTSSPYFDSRRFLYQNLFSVCLC